MSPGLLVREARPAEYAQVGRLSVAAYRADGQLDVAPRYADALADVAARAAQADVLVAVDPDGGPALGTVTFVRPGTPLAELARDGEAEFRMLAVDPAAWGRGVGRTLVDACVARARAIGARAMVICVRDFTERAHRLYAGAGFVRRPELDWAPLPGVNLLALRLELTPA